MGYQFKDVEKEILNLTKRKRRKREFALKQLNDLNHTLLMLRAEKLHKKQFLIKY